MTLPEGKIPLPEGKRVLFGTDGIRGIANKHPMTPEVALQLGKAVARLFTNGKSPLVILGKDTRLSGYMLESALEAGLVSAGATCYLVGPMPTPAIAHLTRSFAADAGIVITASHNPAEHNGIKIFDRDGLKLPDAQELEIEKHVLEGLKMSHSLESAARVQSPDAAPLALGKARRIDDARGRYIEFCKSTIGNNSLKGLKVVLDCANGAAYHITPVILQELGADVITVHDEPDGLNINDGCGATHPDVIQRAVLQHNADAGIALDGDADRVVMCDEHGTIIDGDRLLAILALELKREGRLRHDLVVATEYTNKGFDEAMAKASIKVVRVENGDRYVLEELHKRKAVLGGEQSGHLILLDYATTGDGTIVALQVLNLLKASGRPLSALASVMSSWPQIVLSVAVKERRPFDKMPGVTAAIAEAERRLGSDGRVFVRYSGTELKARVMVEAKDGSLPAKLAERIVIAFQKEAGS